MGLRTIPQVRPDPPLFSWLSSRLFCSYPRPFAWLYRLSLCLCNERGDLTQRLPCFAAGANSQYTLFGAMADLFKFNTTDLVGLHHFNAQDKPEFFNIDANGNVIGSVVGSPNRNLAVSRQSDDGGFGSVPELLLNAIEATGARTRLVQLRVGLKPSREWQQRCVRSLGTSTTALGHSTVA